MPTPLIPRKTPVALAAPLLSFLACGVAFAEDTRENISFSVHGEMQQTYAQQPEYLLNLSGGAVAKNDDDIDTRGVGLEGTYRLPAGSLLSGTFLGEQPKIAFSASRHRGSASNTTTFDNNQPNDTLLNIDGTAGNLGLDRWRAATWYSDLDVETMDLALSVEGAESAAGWSLVPHVGLGFNASEQDYQLNRQLAGNVNIDNVLDGDLDSETYRVSAGINFLSPAAGSWRYGVKSQLSAGLADSSMTIVQNGGSLINGVSTITVKNDKTSAVFEGRLGVFLQKEIGPFTFGTEVFTKGSYGTPYIDLPSGVGDGAEIGTNDSSYAFGGTLSAKINF